MILSTIMVIGSIFLMLFGIIIGGDIGLSFNLPAAVLVNASLFIYKAKL